VLGDSPELGMVLAPGGESFPARSAVDDPRRRIHLAARVVVDRRGDAPRVDDRVQIASGIELPLDRGVAFANAFCFGLIAALVLEQFP
jgi:hypothetical protein